MTLQQLTKILEDLTINKFYGSVEVKLEAGKIVIIKKTESIKLS
jgi:hypothetical protein